MAAAVTWPEWWRWEIEISAHLEKRMRDRRITELDLRTMLQQASAYRRADEEGRWVIETRLGRTRWEVIVEPDDQEELLVIVTAYPLG